MHHVLILLATAFSATLGAAPEAAAPAAQPEVRFGCQARTFGAGVYKDEATFLDVVRQAGEVGFQGLETNWKNLERYFDRPEDFSHVLKEAHLQLIGAHIGGSPWGPTPKEKQLDDVARTAEFVKQLQGQFLVFSGSVPKTRPVPEDTWLTLAQFMNDVGRVCRSHGVRCLYHNHWTDCEAGGLEQLCQRTDPELVGFAFDTGHALHAGRDPASLVGVLGPRLGLIHFADFAEDGPANVHRPPLGEGRLNIPALVAAIRRSGSNPWIVLEEEASSAPGRTLAEKGLAVMRKAFATSGK